MGTKGGILRLDVIEHECFRRNTIQQAICELRFPSLPDIENDPPREFVKRLRHAFPHYEHVVGTNIAITDKGLEQVPQGTHRFLSHDRRWNAWLRKSSLGLETTSYTDFNEFIGQVRCLLDAAEHCLDTDFFTRIGLRYINLLPAAAGDVRGWVNDSILGPLADGPLAGVDEYWSKVRGATEEGTFTLQYGFAAIDGHKGYLLDTDFAVESVDWTKAIDSLIGLNQQSYGLFRWAIGPRTLEHLQSSS